MEINTKSRRELRLQGAGFAVLFLAALALLGWLSTRYHFESDWTAAGRHTLSDASARLLETLDGPVTVTAFVRDEGVSSQRGQIEELVKRYRRKKPDITIAYVNPDLAPDQVRAKGVTLEGEMVVEYKGRSENVQSPTEEALTNTLQRLARSGERTLVFLEGHGERDPQGQANHDLLAWAQQLRNKGFNITKVNLAAAQTIPGNTSALIIASPQTDLLPGEASAVADFVKKGGNVLWLSEPEGIKGLAPLADLVGVTFVPGVVVDPATTQALGIRHPAFTVIADYPPNPVTEGLAITLFPLAKALNANPPEGWQWQAVLRTLENSWSERGPMKGAIRFDQGADTPGPLVIGALFTRDLNEEGGDTGEARRTQRIAVIGDGDFLSNTYLGNGANIELGNHLVNWLSHDDTFITIPAKTTPDKQITLTTLLTVVIGFGFLLLLPGALLGAGVFIWWKRRKG